MAAEADNHVLYPGQGVSRGSARHTLSVMTRPGDLGAQYLRALPQETRHSLVRQAAQLQKAMAPLYQSPGLTATIASAVAMARSAVTDVVKRLNADGTLDALRSILATSQRTLTEQLDLAGVLGGLNSRLLPPNLRSVADQVSAADVWSLLSDEGIPLYRVPRASVATRLLQASTHADRRRVLTTHSRQIIEDCSKALTECTSEDMLPFVDFAQDGLRAMNAGAHRSAQAVFTVTLDTLVAALVPNLRQRRALTKKTRGTDIPDVIEEMDVHTALVWLAVWNGHLEFWVKNGDEIPYDYSRHATIHAVSRRQYSKRNCLQSLMLLTSLISWADEHAISNTR